jgi:heme exporter protein D
MQEPIALTSSELFVDLILCVFRHKKYLERVEARHNARMANMQDSQREHDQQNMARLALLKQMLQEGRITLTQGGYDHEADTRKASNNMMNAQAKLMCAQAEYLQAKADRLNSR